jgi:NAD(P)-dependent dehydrogenase (short-subunit alcohol dehydrogenase family)
MYLGALPGFQNTIFQYKKCGAMGEPPEMAGVMEFLLSEAVSYVTGTVIYADGRWVANGA